MENNQDEMRQGIQEYTSLEVKKIFGALDTEQYGLFGSLKAKARQLWHKFYMWRRTRAGVKYGFFDCINECEKEIERVSMNAGNFERRFVKLKKKHAKLAGKYGSVCAKLKKS